MRKRESNNVSARSEDKRKAIKIKKKKKKNRRKNQSIDVHLESFWGSHTSI
jgi:hypothetical protein